MPASSVVMKAFLSMMARFASFFPRGMVLGNRKLSMLYQLKQSPWMAKNYSSFTLSTLLFLSPGFLNLIVYFLNLLNTGWK